LRWNKQYKKGLWHNLNSDNERIRYDTIIEFILNYGIENPKIMDLGCGEGILYQRLKNLDYDYFLGMDFSSVSINTANQQVLKNAEFICADIHSFTPDRLYDVIIFNEVFYYIHDSEKENVLDRMIAKLTDNGIIITSIFREGRGCWEYFEKKLTQLQFTTISNNDDNVYWKVGVYRKP
jgi:2-polyprenyl-3-methyl-5-hydroxy-6-metoxy-1,4-benzoquinol methylase